MGPPTAQRYNGPGWLRPKDDLRRSRINEDGMATKCRLKTVSALKILPKDSGVRT